MNVSEERIVELQRQGSWLYQKYFTSLKEITLTTLDIINDRVFPENAKNYHEWNTMPDVVFILL